MTESDWNTATDPHEMLAFLRAKGTLSERKARLFAVACCRAIWLLMRRDPSRRAVEVAELYADGEATAEELNGAATEADPGLRFDAASAAAGSPQYSLMDADAPCAAFAGFAAANFTVVGQTLDFPKVTYTAAASATAHWSAKFAAKKHQWRAWRDSEHTALMGQCRLLRDIFNPFRPQPSINVAWLAWNDGIIKQLAEAAYEFRSLPGGQLDNERLAVLADALEEVGADAFLIDHLRSLEVHVRGCFAIDLLTGRGS